MSFYSEYYDQEEFWDKDYLTLPAERERILQAVSLIPKSGVTRILDVGCGNGAFLHALPNQYETVGIDLSATALKHVRTTCIQGRSSSLPFPAGSFDLVTCFEVLEHLPHDEFIQTLSELERVANKFIMVSVPNAEDLDLNLVVCPECSCWYHPFRHVRSFDHKSLAMLFSNFRLKELRVVGPLDERFPSLFIRMRRIWIKPSPPLTAICPQCGYSPKIAPGRSSSERGHNKPTIRVVKAVVRAALPRARARRWLLALYDRSEV